uniref:regulatory protein RecX n=1 Tax=Alistipes sp. TaxID=1872444 RepID=UPI004056FF9D
MEQPLKPKPQKSPEKALASLQMLCARREYSSGDALRLMERWGVEPLARRKVLEALVRDRFIDDARYAEAFVREKSRLNGWGSHKIRQGLRLKGVAPALIEQALEMLRPEETEGRLRQLLEQKRPHLKAKDRYDLRSKLIRFALSRGYGYSMVSEQIDQLLREVL